MPCRDHQVDIDPVHIHLPLSQSFSVVDAAAAAAASINHPSIDTCAYVCYSETA